MAIIIIIIKIIVINNLCSVIPGSMSKRFATAIHYTFKNSTVYIPLHTKTRDNINN